MRPVGVSSHVFYLRTLMANVVFVSDERQQGGEPRWVLVDAGMPGYASTIADAARLLFGRSARPSAVILSHGHFDHVGSLDDLLRTWGDVPVYAHPLELPYLAGRSVYPPPDPLVGGGLFSLVSRAFPWVGANLATRVEALPESGAVPGLPGWRWLHTPGHSPGHVSLFRESDRTLVAGDAVTTVKQESVVAVVTQHRRVHGPPAYFTIDWDQARASVGRLADLEPSALVTGHGRPMYGALLRTQLRELAGEFLLEAEPAFGRYVSVAARTDLHGIVSLPPDPLPKVMTGLLTAAGALAAGGAWWWWRRQRIAATASGSAAG
jgi:glyoxylase-like metal-dependent hydrolase (beta-lactamase superfamily II)